MAYSVIRVAILGAWLCAPAFAQTEGRDRSRGSSLPGDATAQLRSDESRDAEGMRKRERRDLGGRQDLEGVEGDEDIREAPGAAPGTAPGGRVAPGQQPYRGAPGAVEPGAEVPAGTPEAGRRWGLIVFVIAIVALGLLAFRRRGPTPPAP